MARWRTKRLQSSERLSGLFVPPESGVHTISRSCIYPLTFLLSALLSVSEFAPKALAGEVVLAWNANTGSNLGGYYLYYGTSSRQYSSRLDVGNTTTCTVSGLADGTYYFSLTAYSLAGRESSFSTEVSATLGLTDNKPPAISGVATSEVTYSSARVVWATDEAADTQVEYGLSTSYDSQTTLDPLLATAHSQILNGLAPTTTYHFRVVSKDAAGNLAASDDFTFSTTAPPDTTPPVISSARSSSVSDKSATITWTTNEPADSQVEYGTSTAYGSTTTLDPARTTSHSQVLSGLIPGTTYHYRVTSRDAAGNVAVSDDLTFATGAPPDTTKPTISSIRSSAVSNDSVTITWTTDEPADSQVEYGTSAAYGSITVRNPALTTSHSQVLGRLSSGTTYHFRVMSADGAGNISVSSDNVFSTPRLPDIITGLVAAYAFDEGAGSVTVDVSGNSNLAKVTGASWTSKAKFGKALSFNGKNSYVSAGINGLPGINDPKTVSCWLYSNGGQGTTQSVIVLANEEQRASVQHEFKSSKVGFLQFGETWLVAANPPSSKTWHHFGYTFDGTRHNLFVDGVLVSSSTISPQTGPATSFQIGRWIGGTEYFKGTIDEVRIYNRALSQEEIQSVMNTPINGPQPAPLSFAAPPAVEYGSDPEGLSALTSAENTAFEGSPESQPDFQSEIRLRLSKISYAPGETIRTTCFWIRNLSPHNRDMELKVWLSTPDLVPVGMNDSSASGILTLPAAFDNNLGTVVLFDVPDMLDSGPYLLGVRMLDPVTGDISFEDFVPLTVSTKKGGAAVASVESSDARDPYTDVTLQLDLVESEPVEPGRRPELSIVNAGFAAIPIEVKMWRETAGRSPAPLFSLGEEGSMSLAAGSSLSIYEPICPETAPCASLNGTVYLRSRILDPRNGRIIKEINSQPLIR